MALTGRWQPAPKGADQGYELEAEEVTILGGTTEVSLQPVIARLSSFIVQSRLNRASDVSNTEEIPQSGVSPHYTTFAVKDVTQCRAGPHEIRSGPSCV